jgi:dTDP-4-amino-4,6-dideoxygalactose transaminase
MPPFEEYCDEIKDLWSSHWLTNMGAKHRALEALLKDYLDAPNLTLFSNGHLALEAILRTFDLNGEVITTPYTFASTTHAIIRCGLTPVFCDIKPDFTMDPEKIEPLITGRTSAILPVHVYGNLCDHAAIERIARRHGLKVIYDAAHAFGVSRGGVAAAQMGDASMFSFHATKVFHSIEGGAVCFQDAERRRRLELEKNFGIAGPEQVEAVGGNAKMNEFQAAMGICNLRHIDAEISKRKAVARRYQERLSDVPGLSIWWEQDGVKPNYGYFAVIVDENAFGVTRDALYEKLLENDVYARKYFYPATNEMACCSGRFDPGQTPRAAEASRRVLTLPIYGDLSPEDVDRVCDVILGA